MDDTQPDIVVRDVASMTDREKLVAIAESHANLMALKDKQNETAAAMIRSCVAAIQRQPTSWDDTARRRLIIDDRKRAFEGLEALAVMLDRTRNVRLSDEQSKD